MTFQKTKMPELSKEDFINELESLGSLSKIASKYGVSKNTISYYFKKLDIPYNKKVAQYPVDHNFFSKEDEGSFYWAGFLAADGCILIRKNFNNKNIILTLGEKDLNHLQLFKETLKSGHPIKTRIVENSKINSDWTDRNLYTITVGSHKIVEDLERFNIVPRKTKVYDFPDWLINHPLVNHFMRGYFDGDGSIYIHSRPQYKDQYKLSIAGNYSFLSNFGSIISEKLQIDNKSINSNGPVYVLSYGGNNLTSKIGSFLYDQATVYIERKYNLWKKCYDIQNSIG